MFMSKNPTRDQPTSKLESAKQTSLRVLADASETAAPKLREAADRARPQVEALADRANDQVHEWADKLEAYRPEATERAGKFASNAATSLSTVETPKLIDDLAVRLTGDKKAMKKARKALASAGKKIEK